MPEQPHSAGAEFAGAKKSVLIFINRRSRLVSSRSSRLLFIGDSDGCLCRSGLKRLARTPSTAASFASPSSRAFRGNVFPHKIFIRIFLLPFELGCVRPVRPCLLAAPLRLSAVHTISSAASGGRAINSGNCVTPIAVSVPDCYAIGEPETKVIQKSKQVSAPICRANRTELTRAGEILDSICGD